MDVISLAFAFLFYSAALILVCGTSYKLWGYYKIKPPLKITLTPAPRHFPGVVWRMCREVFFFASLFRANKTTWLFSLLLHVALGWILLRHLRYFHDSGSLLSTLQSIGKYAGFPMVLGLAGLWARRFLVDRIRYISAPSDHLLLALLLAITLSGMTMSFVKPVNVLQVKYFFQGLITFDWQPLPPEPLVYLHLSLVVILMAIFPISKLLHAPGILFSPTLNQRDNPREQRYINAAYQQNTQPPPANPNIDKPGSS